MTAATDLQRSPPEPAANDLRFMARALDLAAETISLASPNPQVGCVLAANGTILGEGAHLYDARDHAEIVALKQAAALGHTVTGATAYVTLEPCSHQGRTGPCADDLIRSGIARCVVATTDPNPLVSGQGIARLRAAGITVTVGTLAQRARDLNDPFAHFIQHRRPYVTLKAALSADGKLAPPPSARVSNQPHWLTGPAARAQVQRLRHAADAVLTGIGTVLADDPALTDRSGLLGPTGQPRRRPLLRVLLDPSLRTPLTSQLTRSIHSDLLILHAPEASPDRRAALRTLGAELLPIPTTPTGRLSLPAVLDELGRRNLLSLLLECGSNLNGAFLTQGLVDRAILFYSQAELGDQALPFAAGIPSPFLFEHSLRRVTRTTFGPDACVTGALTDPWPTPSH
jgi:diaminohydroxyphosphoribosylaminopyrimidine deaminase / 5-amino-6-(5-phosphoribosylamino)uracil reductase